jgi:predicted enzyme related to lactoylglutathione lyase
MAKPSVRGKFLWHELMTTDPAAAERFYGNVVGWKSANYENDPNYKTWMAGGQARGGLMAQRVEGGTGPKPQWFNYIGTPNVDETVRQAVELGGRVMRPAWDIPQVGRIAFLTDPQGAPFALLAPLPREGSLPDPNELGSFSWHELLSTNWQVAWDFYSKLFGWQKTRSMDMGELGTYQMFGQDGVTYGGMFTKSSATPGPPLWIAYSNVPDAKRAADAISKSGGMIMNGPMDVPDGGSIVTAADPQGAVFAVFSKKNLAKPAAAAPKKSSKPAKASKNATKKASKKKAAPPRRKARAAKAKRKTTRKTARKRATRKRR